MKLKPFMSYYGSKYRDAKKYPAPRYPLIIEPFAGAGGYSLNYADRNVVLVDLNPRIASIWQYLIEATPEQVMSLPLLGLDQHVDEIRPGVDPRAIELIRQWLNSATTTGRNRFSKNAKYQFAKRPAPAECWSSTTRARIAGQVNAIKHWHAKCTTYDRIPDFEATWFVDPPYNNRAGSHYPHGPKGIDYAHLAEWCRSRRGQVIVCENAGADWLPFQPLHVPTARLGRGAPEVVWLA